jgi:ubiquinone/menaquinone biosynthesis C-methylase UbiE
MKLDEAIRYMRTQPQYAELVRATYLGEDVLDSAERFTASGEFVEVRRMLGDERLRGATVVDLGAGIGISSFAFARQSAKQVYAIEPDPSQEVGYGALVRLRGELPIEVVESYGESIPLPDGVADVVYARQVLHHTRDLPLVLRECARLLKPGGAFLACREHVVDNEEQMKAFLAGHAVHQLAGGENAYSLPQYLQAIHAAGLRLDRALGPTDTVVNLFPFVQTQEEVDRLPEIRLRKRFGAVGAAVAAIPGVSALTRRWMNRALPGRLYTFLAFKAPSA